MYDRCPVHRGDLDLVQPRCDRGEFFPGRGLFPVIRHSCWRLIDLGQDKGGVAGGRGRGVHRVRQLRSFHEVVEQQGLLTLASMRTSQPLGVAGENAIAFRDRARGSREDDGELGLLLVRHGHVLSKDLHSSTTMERGERRASTGQLAFAVATVLNGEVVQCTNFVGAATGAQRQSIVSIGAMLMPRPTENAICACKQPAASGTFATDATAISYTTSFGQQTGCGTNPGPGCSTTYTPPPVA